MELENKFVLNDIFNSSADPLVLAAWRCKNLSEIVFIGQKYLLDCLLAIVRLRHDALKKLEFGESNIVYEESWSDREAIIDVSGGNGFSSEEKTFFLFFQKLD